ncbi:zinc finger protein 461-like [Trichosurus vulpecula]|uniref:zinc finger protein 461-like n=1 Tax=Trichosurus vulpecula TaxID=9337 RepID=UPI00186AED97|nr:zinc finger protein 461-like [Trichosurus vulpecula]
MWLWASPRRSGASWTIIRRRCTGRSCWKMRGTCSPWVRKLPLLTLSLQSKGISSFSEGEIRREVKKTSAELSLFVEETHEQRFMGDIPCDFTWREICALHQGIHTGKKPYGSSQCGKDFRSTSSLTEHQRINTGEKTYEYIQCRKAFRSRSTLAKHQRIHTGEKTYKCNQCGKVFRFTSIHIVHQRIHNGEKLFECNQPGKLSEAVPILLT